MTKVVAIGGVSRAGKSTLANWLHQQLPGSVVLSQDDFPNDEKHIPQIRDRIDWEHPQSIHWYHWKRAIDSQLPDCSYLILEGLFAFRPESEVIIQPDLRYYLSIDQDRFLKLRRQETRWGIEPEWFIRHVWDSHFLYGVPGPDQTAHKYHQPNEHDYQEILSQVKT